MAEPSKSPQADGPRILDYARPGLLPRRPAKYLGVTIALAVGLQIAISVAGVSSDRIRIPLAKKIALTLAAAVIITLITRAVHRRRFGCAVLALLYALWTAMNIAVMWFWN